jgi:hypothetical protein
VCRFSEEAVAAFEPLKEALGSAPVLALPRWDLPFILTTDWSCGAILAVQRFVAGLCPSH